VADVNDCPRGNLIFNEHEYQTHVLACRKCDLHVDPTMVSADGKRLDGDRELNAVQLVESMLRNLTAQQRANVLAFCSARAALALAGKP
jgi:hypothetical protein